MAHDDDTRGRILNEAEAMIRFQGLAGLSLSPLADRVGIRKPSLFHHFRDKHSLTRAVVERYSTRFFSRLDAIVDGSAAPRTRLRRVSDLYEQGLLEPDGPQGQVGICLCAALSGDLDELDERSRTAVRAFFEGVESRLSRLLEVGRAEGQFALDGSPATTARALVAALEGAHLSARVHGDTSVFRRIARLAESGLAGTGRS